MVRREEEGGGVYVAGGTLTLTNATVSFNTVQGGNGGYGVDAGGNGGNASGGGVYVAGGTATLTNATLSSNTAVGGLGGGSSDARRQRRQRLRGRAGGERRHGHTDQRFPVLQYSSGRERRSRHLSATATTATAATALGAGWR